MLTRGLAIVAASAAIAAIAGCSGENKSAGTPKIADVTSVSPRPTEPPPVGRVLDIRSYVDRPCDLLAREQIEALEARTSTGPNLGNANFCTLSMGKWKDINLNPVVDEDVFGRVYRDSGEERPKGSGKLRWTKFESGTIGEQPVVVQSNDSVCEVVVGTGPNSGIHVIVYDGQCPRAVSVAEQIVGNLTRPT